MAHTDHPPDEPRHEKRDVRIAPIVWLGVGIIVLAVVTHVVIAFFLVALERGRERSEPPLPPLVAKESPKLPKDLRAIPPPRLQSSDILDMDEYRKDSLAVLNSYGWSDEKNGVARIPIDRAIELLAKDRALAAKLLPIRSKE